MSVKLRLMLIVVLVAMVPLSVSAVLTLRVHQQAFDEALGALHRKTAENAAARVHSALSAVEQNLERLNTKVVVWSELSAVERDAALWLVYREHPDVLSSSLLSRDGGARARNAFVVPETAPEEPEHPVASPELVARLLANVRASGALGLGQPIVDAAVDAPVLPVEIPVEGADGEAWTVLVMLSLRGACSEVRVSGADAMEVLLFDEKQHLLCGPPGLRVGAGVAGVTMEAGNYAPAHYIDETGTEMMQSSVQLPRGWWAVAQRPSEVALAPSQRMRWLGAYCLAVSLLAAMVIGLLLARSITEPIRALMDTARRFGEGHYERRVSPAGRGELAALGQAFDLMGREICERDREIRDFNDKLQERVDAQTAELSQAQEQLLSSQKNAVLSTLSAGIAAEVNNPLTGVLGLAQLLRARSEGDPARAREGEMLSQIEQAAQRIRTVMMGLLALSKNQERNKFSSVNLNDLLASTARLVKAEAEGKGVVLACEFSLQPLVVEGDFTQLQQALLQLLTNAVSATDRDGQVHVRPRQESDKSVSVVITDNGSGIPVEVLDRIYEPFFTTKKAAEGAGLGLTVAHRIVEQHHGTLSAESDLGVGTRVTVTLPTVRALEASL